MSIIATLLLACKEPVIENAIIDVPDVNVTVPTDTGTETEFVPIDLSKLLVSCPNLSDRICPLHLLPNDGKEVAQDCLDAFQPEQTFLDVILADAGLAADTMYDGAWKAYVYQRPNGDDGWKSGFRVVLNDVENQVNTSNDSLDKWPLLSLECFQSDLIDGYGDFTGVTSNAVIEKRSADSLLENSVYFYQNNIDTPEEESIVRINQDLVYGSTVAETAPEYDFTRTSDELERSGNEIRNVVRSILQTQDESSGFFTAFPQE